MTTSTPVSPPLLVSVEFLTTATARFRRWSLAATMVLATFAPAGPIFAAASRPSGAVACAATPGDTSVTIATVSDDLDVTLADGRVLRLVGIDPPRATPTSPDLPADARQVLDAWSTAPGAPLMLHPLAAALDRWGRVPALLFRDEADPSSAADALVRAGAARAKPEPGAQACMPALLAAESDARATRRGLWADPRYAVLAATDADGLAAQAGGMALAEGLLHLHEGRGGLYLALGRDRRGFVAIVSRRDVQRFAKVGLDLHDYDGTPVRLRGDLDVRFGPRLHVTDPDAVESLEPGSLPDEPDAKHWTSRAADR